MPADENLPPLPAGHPPVPGMGGAAPGGLPSGHPDISGMGAKAPTGAMPSGHPDISSMMQGGKPGTPATQPAGMVTTVNVQAVQGTTGGPAVGTDEVRIEVVDAHTNSVVAKVEGKLNEQGAVRVGGLPVGPAYQPVVTVVHNGVAYRAYGEPMNSAAPKDISVQVFETTDRDPGWEVRMRHVMLQPMENGVQVMDVIAVANDSDRSYIGAAQPDNSRVTFALPLASNAKDVTFMAGFDDCCSKIVDGKIVNSMAILPGANQYQYTYFVPMVDGKTELLATSPALAKQVMVLIPDDGTEVTVTGGLESGVTDMGGRKIRYFKAGGVQANSEIKVTVAGKPTKATGAAAAPTGSAGTAAVSPFASADIGQMAKAIAGVGALLIVLFGGALLVRKPIKTVRAAG